MGSACSGDASDKYETDHLDVKSTKGNSGHGRVVSGVNVSHLSAARNADRPSKLGANGHARGGSLDIGFATEEMAALKADALAAAGEEGGEAKAEGETGPAAAPARVIDASQLDKLKAATLKSSVFGECLSLAQLQFLASQCDMKKWSRIGDRICEQGTKADVMYVVHKGEVLLEVEDDAIDNRANQFQIAKIMKEQDLIPITDADGNPVANNLTVGSGAANRKSKTKSKSGDHIVHPSTLHPSSIAHPSQAHASAKGSVGHSNAARHSGPLTRAELIAIEAAARIEESTATSNGEEQPQRPHKTKHSLLNGSKELDAKNPIAGDTSSILMGSQIVTISQALNDPELFNKVTSTIPSLYRAQTNKMFMCVKTATHTFGVGMFFANGRYMYSGINNSLSTVLIVLPRKAFEALWQKWPEVRADIMKHLGEYLEDKLSLASWLSNASVVPRNKLPLLASLFQHAKVPADTMLFEEGTICNDESPLYFILEGAVELTFTNEKGHKLAKLLPKGSVFGELGVLLGFSITASARTLGECTFRLCKRRWLNLFAMMCPQLVPTLRTTLHQNYHVRDEQLLENLHVQSLFTEFCLGQFSAENIEFWTVAIRFRKVVFPNQSLTMDEILAEAAMIYNRYISETSVLQINIKQSVRQNIKQTLQSGEVTKDLFASAEREVCQLMLQDSFVRFKATPLYTTALSLLHAPPPLPILLNHVNTASSAVQIRAKEYSRTDSNGVAHTTQQTNEKAIPRSQFMRQISLDDQEKANENTLAIPLMFGGGQRKHSTISISPGISSRQARVGTSENGTNHTPTTPLSAPIKEAQLTLSPATDKFRVHNGIDRMASLDEQSELPSYQAPKESPPTSGRPAGIEEEPENQAPYGYEKTEEEKSVSQQLDERIPEKIKTQSRPVIIPPSDRGTPHSVPKQKLVPRNQATNGESPNASVEDA